MKKLFRHIVLFINALAVLSLLGAFFAPMINPEKVPFLAFWGLIMPYSLIINLFFIVFWVLKARMYFVISLLAIMLSWSTIKTSFPYKRTEKTEAEKSLKVLSYNVRVFDRYQWSKEKNVVTEMLRFIKNQKADVLCFQEFGTSRSAQDGITENFILNALCEYPYHYIHYAPRSLEKRHQTGLAILSKHPIEERGHQGDANLSKGGSIYADILIKTETIRIVNAHFESIHFSDKYDIIKGIDGENYKTRIKGAAASVRQAAISHTSNANDVIYLHNSSPYPLILCADMNNTPVSYSYRKISKSMQDAFLHQGRGFGSTYNGLYPFLRIDFIFHDKTLPLLNYKREKVNYSDHYPLMAEFALGIMTK